MPAALLETAAAAPRPGWPSPWLDRQAGRSAEPRCAARFASLCTMAFRISTCMLLNKPHFLLALAVATVSPCGRPEVPPVKAEAVPWVRTIAVQGSVSGGLGTSGTVRARGETPLAVRGG